MPVKTKVAITDVNQHLIDMYPLHASDSLASVISDIIEAEATQNDDRNKTIETESFDDDTELTKESQDGNGGPTPSQNRNELTGESFNSMFVEFSTVTGKILKLNKDLALLTEREEVIRKYLCGETVLDEKNFVVWLRQFREIIKKLSNGEGILVDLLKQKEAMKQKLKFKE